MRVKRATESNISVHGWGSTKRRGRRGNRWRRRRRRRRRGDGRRSGGQWSTLNAVFGTEVGGFAEFFTAFATSASASGRGRSGGSPDAKLTLRISLLRGNAVVHVAVGDFAVGATAEVVEVDGDVAVHHRLEAAAVVVVLTSLVADEEDDDDEDEQDDKGGQGADDDADVVVAVLFVLLLLVHAVRALVVCGVVMHDVYAHTNTALVSGKPL